MARLILLSGAPGGSEKSPSPEKTIELGTDAVSIGRDAANTLVIEGEAKSSRRHCQVVPMSGGGYEVVDLKSTNGTRVNGDAIERRRLRPGDTIEVGLTKIRFVDESAAAATGGGGAPGECYLEITAGDAKGQRVALTAARTTFGRRETNTVVLKDKMASGHHAEISRDLNGFTLRDLGSTNGTLVNGEPVTETLLSHGSRLRIGNARYVFKDPSMSDVDVAAGGDDEDAGWGMMGELDLEKVKSGGGAGGLLAALALLAALGAGAFVLGSRPSRGPSTDVDVANLLGDGTFDASEGLLWTVDEASPATATRTTSGRPGGGGALQVRHDAAKGAGVGMARYGDDLELLSGAVYRASAQMRRDGPSRGDLAIQWVRYGNVRTGSTAITQTVRLGAPTKAAAFQAVSRVFRRPGWAEGARLVVVVGPDTTVKLDDLRLETVATNETISSKLEAVGGADAAISSTGGLDLSRTATVLLAGATPWARMPGGRVLGGVSAFEAVSASGDAASREIKGRLLDDQGEVPATITWKTTADGPVATVSVPGAEAVGLGAGFPRSHVQDGIGVVGSSGSQRIAGQGGQSLDDVRKALLGEPRAVETVLGDPSDPQRSFRAVRPATLVALDSPGAEGGGLLKTLDGDDGSLLTTVLWRTGDAGEFRLMTKFDSEGQRGRARLREAVEVLDRDAAGGIAALRQVAEEFAFQADIRQPALDKAAARETQAREDQKALAEAVARHEIFRDAPSLAAAEARALALSTQFPESGAPSLITQNVKDLRARVNAARLRLDLERAGPEVRRLTRLAALLEQEKGFEPVAAIYYDAVVRRFEKLGAAASGPGGDAEIGKLIEDSRERRDALLAKPEVRAAVPNLE